MKCMILNVFAVALTGLLLAGCSGDVDVVKNGVLPDFQTITIGNALDNYPYFSSRTWTTLETANKTKIVEFKGFIKLEKTPELVEKFNTKAYCAWGDYCKQITYSHNPNNRLAMLIQFTMNVDKSFNITFIGACWYDSKGKYITQDMTHPEELLDALYQGNKNLPPKVIAQYLSWQVEQTAAKIPEIKAIIEARQ